MLFNRLPDNLFAPLAGPNRAVYARCLAELHGLFFEEAGSELAPARETVRAQLEETLASLGHIAWQAEEDEALDDLAADTAVHAQRVYRRLLDCGWLDEEPEGYRVRTLMPPAAGMVLGTMMDVADNRRLSYGGIVLSIYNNVRNALADPESLAPGFHQACQDARAFSRHLNGMVYGLKGLLAGLRDLPDRRLMLERFFSDFVERFLVADYTTLKTRDNPFRFRAEILHIGREVRFDPALTARLTAGYRRHLRHPDEDAARAAVDRDLIALTRIFEGIDEALDRIDRYRYRFERRAADTVRYMDRTQPGSAGRIARLLGAMGLRAEEALERAGAAGGFRLARPRPISAHGLRRPPPARVTPLPVALRTRPVDLEALAAQQRLQQFLLRRRVNPAAIAAYLDRHLPLRQWIPAIALPIDSAEDLIAFAHIRHLSALGPPGERLARRYHVRAESGVLENRWLRCAAFSVQRLSD